MLVEGSYELEFHKEGTFANSETRYNKMGRSFDDWQFSRTLTLTFLRQSRWVHWFSTNISISSIFFKSRITAFLLHIETFPKRRRCIDCTRLCLFQSCSESWKWRSSECPDFRKNHFHITSPFPIWQFSSQCPQNVVLLRGEETESSFLPPSAKVTGPYQDRFYSPFEVSKTDPCSSLEFSGRIVCDKIGWKVPLPKLQKWK